MDKRITGRLSDGTAFVRSETGNEGVGHFTTQRRLPEIITKLAKLEDKIENGDLVEVVRCKDCIFRGREDCAMFYRCDCGEQHTWECNNDFCSYGERKINDV